MVARALAGGIRTDEEGVYNTELVRAFDPAAGEADEEITEQQRAAQESAAQAAEQRAEAERLQAAKEEIRLEQQARRAEANADAIDPEEEQ